MAEKDIYSLDFLVDKLTDSILNSISGDSFQTEVSLLSNSDLKTVSKSKGWLFDWQSEFHQPDREVYKLTIADNQGKMGYLREPEGVDFVIQSKPLTKKREKELSAYIAKRKKEILREKPSKGSYSKKSV